jgi:hypothetical protein
MGNKNCFSGSSIKDLPDHCALISESNASFKLIPYQQFLYLWNKYFMRFSFKPDFSAAGVALIDVNCRAFRSKEGGKRGGEKRSGTSDVSDQQAREGYSED